MWKTAVSVILVAAAPAQTVGNRFEKAPPNVSDALTARATEFYRDHVEGKYRKAEALVSIDSKDGFYAATKPALESFKLGDVVFSDKYSKAKVTVIGKMLITFMGMSGPQLMDVPFPSYWKLEHGKWCWYIYQDPNRMTPFGKVTAKQGADNGADPGQAFLSAPNLAMVLNGVKTDKKEVRLTKTPGTREIVTLTNQLAGAVSLGLDAEQYPGLSVRVEPHELKQGEKAAVTIETAAAASYVNRIVRVLVKPSNQVIDVMVRFQ